MGRDLEEVSFLEEEEEEGVAMSQQTCWIHSCRARMFLYLPRARVTIDRSAV